MYACASVIDRECRYNLHAGFWFLRKVVPVNLSALNPVMLQGEPGHSGELLRDMDSITEPSLQL